MTSLTLFIYISPVIEFYSSGVYIQAIFGDLSIS